MFYLLLQRVEVIRYHPNLQAGSTVPIGPIITLRHFRTFHHSLTRSSISIRRVSRFPRPPLRLPRIISLTPLTSHLPKRHSHIRLIRIRFRILRRTPLIPITKSKNSGTNKHLTNFRSRTIPRMRPSIMTTTILSLRGHHTKPSLRTLNSFPLLNTMFLPSNITTIMSTTTRLLRNISRRTKAIHRLLPRPPLPMLSYLNTNNHILIHLNPSLTKLTPSMPPTVHVNLGRSHGSIEYFSRTPAPLHPNHKQCPHRITIHTSTRSLTDIKKNMKRRGVTSTITVSRAHVRHRQGIIFLRTLRP